jgi:hypothetical protein
MVVTNNAAAALVVIVITHTAALNQRGGVTDAQLEELLERSISTGDMVMRDMAMVALGRLKHECMPSWTAARQLCADAILPELVS